MNTLLIQRNKKELNYNKRQKSLIENIVGILKPISVIIINANRLNSSL